MLISVHNPHALFSKGLRCLFGPACLWLFLATAPAWAAAGQPTLDDILQQAASPAARSAPAYARATVETQTGPLRSQEGIFSKSWNLLVQFRWAVLGSVAAAFLCSLMGTLMLARRMMLLGIALPQSASAGIAFSILLAQWAKNWTLQPGQSPFLEERTMTLLASFGSVGAVLLVLLVLAWAERKAVFAEAQWATVYISSAALLVLFLVINPYGEAHIGTMLEGNVITVTQTQFRVLTGVAVGVGGMMTVFRKEFLLVSFDPDMASSLRLNQTRWSGILYVLLGLTVSTGVMITGPMFAFGFLLLPPFAARPWAVGMRNFYLLSTAIGVSVSVVGCLVSFGADWPMGPSQILVASIVLLLSRLLFALRARFHARTGMQNGAV